MVERRSRHKSRFDDDAAVFYDCVLPTTYNLPLYITVSVKGVELKRAMLDPGSSIKIISLLTVAAVGVPRDKIVRQPIEVSSFRDQKAFTVGFVNRPYRGTYQGRHPFQVIDLQTSYICYSVSPRSIVTKLYNQRTTNASTQYGRKNEYISTHRLALSKG